LHHTLLMLLLPAAAADVWFMTLQVGTTGWLGLPGHWATAATMFAIASTAAGAVNAAHTRLLLLLLLLLLLFSTMQVGITGWLG
jgi:hypothetical protein